MVFVGVEVRLWPRSSPIRRVLPVLVVVSFKPGYRLCAVSSAEFLDRIMTCCRSGGVGLKGAGHAHVIWVLLFWWFTSSVPPVSRGACGIRMREFLWVSRGESFAIGGGCRYE